MAVTAAVLLQVLAWSRHVDIIKGAPTEGLTYNPNDPQYMNRESLSQELARVFEICHLCRLCFNLCPSFPSCSTPSTGTTVIAANLPPAEIDDVIDYCYQCKLCYVKCPYTPDDKHEFQLDFPRLLQRANIVRAKEHGIGLRARLLARPETLGKMAKLTPALANWANRQPLFRAGLEAAIGIHKDKLLPEFHGQPFRDWLAHQPTPSGDAGKAVLFSTCFVNYNNPELGRDVVDVFSRSGISLGCPEQNCCGMPALEAGDLELARKMAISNVAALHPYVRAGKKILAINPTCSYMMRKEYGDLVDTAEAREVAAATMDVCEYLFQLKQEGKFNRDFRSTPELVGYHIPCHLKAQNIGFRSRDPCVLSPERP